VIYIEHPPAGPLRECIRMLWYTRAPQLTHQRERVLPNGCVQVILNLARDFLWDCPENAPQRHAPAALVVGARSAYEIVDSSDMADLIGIVFRPGGFAAFCSDAVHAFSNQSVSLEDAWGASTRALRDQLREIPDARMKLGALEKFLLEKFAHRIVRNHAVKFALSRFGQYPTVSTVQQVADETGWSLRHFSQIFREQVGLSPKVWCRIQRFQRAVRQLHSGADVRWADLAVDCGYYDQSHFANEFRAFSGIDATSYSARRGPWANHIKLD
jgi:AraC-like DNA-binding protein